MNRRNIAIGFSAFFLIVAFQQCSLGGSDGNLGQTNGNSVSPPPTTVQSVFWQGVLGATVSLSGNVMTKTAAEGWGDSGAYSVQGIPSGSGYVEFSTNETSTYKMAGLSHGDFDTSYLTNQFAIYPSVGGVLYVMEDGGSVSAAGFGNYVPGDVFRVAVESGIIRYYKNGSLIYTSTKTPKYPLIADVALYTTGATITNAKVQANAGLVSYANVSGGPNGVGDGGNIDRAAYCPTGTTIVSGVCRCNGGTIVSDSLYDNHTWHCGCSPAAPVGYIVALAICR